MWLDNKNNKKRITSFGCLLGPGTFYPCTKSYEADIFIFLLQKLLGGSVLNEDVMEPMIPTLIHLIPKLIIFLQFHIAPDG